MFVRVTPAIFDHFFFHLTLINIIGFKSLAINVPWCGSNYLLFDWILDLMTAQTLFNDVNKQAVSYENMTCQIIDLLPKIPMLLFLNIMLL